jgi:hypothetical protein
MNISTFLSAKAEGREGLAEHLGSREIFMSIAGKGRDLRNDRLEVLVLLLQEYLINAAVNTCGR